MTTHRFGNHDYDDAQIQVARVTALQVRMLGLWHIPTVAAICTQMVESSLKGAIWWGDTPTSTSRGAYQQKDFWVWPNVRGTDVDPRRTIGGGTIGFIEGGYDRGCTGLLAQPWVTQPIGITCQKVQRSAYPDRYNELLPDAEAMYAYLQTDPKMQAMVVAL